MKRTSYLALLKYSKYIGFAAKALNKITKEKIFIINAADAIFYGIKEVIDFVSLRDALDDIDEGYCLDGVPFDIFKLFLNDVDKRLIACTAHGTDYYRGKLIEVPISLQIDIRGGTAYNVVVRTRLKGAFLNELQMFFWEKFSNNVVISSMTENPPQAPFKGFRALDGGQGGQF